MAECKVTMPEITRKMRAVEDDNTSLKDIMTQAKKERENSAKVPQIPMKSVQKKGEHGEMLTVDVISEC